MPVLEQLATDQTDPWQVVPIQIVTPYDCLLISVAFVVLCLWVTGVIKIIKQWEKHKGPPLSFKGSRGEVARYIFSQFILRLSRLIFVFLFYFRKADHMEKHRTVIIFENSTMHIIQCYVKRSTKYGNMIATYMYHKKSKKKTRAVHALLSVKTTKLNAYQLGLEGSLQQYVLVFHE